MSAGGLDAHGFAWAEVVGVDGSSGWAVSDPDPYGETGEAVALCTGSVAGEADWAGQRWWCYVVDDPAARALLEVGGAPLSWSGVATDEVARSLLGVVACAVMAARAAARIVDAGDGGPAVGAELADGSALLVRIAARQCGWIE